METRQVWGLGVLISGGKALKESTSLRGSNNYNTHLPPGMHSRETVWPMVAVTSCGATRMKGSGAGEVEAGQTTNKQTKLLHNPISI